jgi:hypothetical protein
MIVDYSFLGTLSENISKTLTLSGLVCLISVSGSRWCVDFLLPVVFVKVCRHSPKSLQFFMPIGKLTFSLDKQIWPNVNFVSRYRLVTNHGLLHQHSKLLIVS